MHFVVVVDLFDPPLPLLPFYPFSPLPFPSSFSFFLLYSPSSVLFANCLTFSLLYPIRFVCISFARLSPFGHLRFLCIFSILISNTHTHTHPHPHQHTHMYHTIPYHTSITHKQATNNHKHFTYHKHSFLFFIYCSIDSID